MIPYGKQSIDNSDIDAVANVLRSKWLTTGPMVAEFEQAFADRLGAKHAVAVCNGTAVLHLAMLVTGICPGDRVVTSANTFLASANCAAFVGATPDFCDIDPVSYNLCPRTLGEQWKVDTKAVVAVDYAGQTAAMPAIAAVARSHGAVVIEDACHAIGGRFEHRGATWSVGAHPWADVTTFSFHAVKSMTTGEGGMLVTDNDQYAQSARRLRTHGIVRSQESFVGLADDPQPDTRSRGEPDQRGESDLSERGPWYYEMQELGFNYRITDFQSARGMSQLSRLDDLLIRRRKLVAQYNEAFKSLKAIQIPALRNPADRELTSWHLYTLQIDFEQLGISRTALMNQLRDRGIGSQVLYIPVHLQPWYRRNYGYMPGKCPVAEQFYLNALSLPLYPDLGDEEQASVTDAIISLCSDASSRRES